MANIKISELVETVTLNDTDIMIVENATETKKMTVATLKNKMVIPVNVKDFGAIGDNTADDTVAIQNAIDYADSTSRSVYFPAGAYKITSTLILGTSSKLVGEGSRKSTLRVSTAIVAINVLGTVGTPVYYFEISDLGIIGGSAGTVGIKLDYAREGIFKNCYVTGFAKGITLNWSWSNSFIECNVVANSVTNIELGDQSNDTVISDCQLNNGGNYGIHIADDSQGVRIMNCVIQQCGKEGILADAGMAISIIGCYLEGNSNLNLGTPDIGLTGSAHAIVAVTIEGTQIWSMYSSVAVRVVTVDRVLLLGCSIRLLGGATTTSAMSVSSNTPDVRFWGCTLDQPAQNMFAIKTGQVEGRTYFTHRVLATGVSETIFSITGSNRVEWEKALDMNNNQLIYPSLLLMNGATASRPSGGAIYGTGQVFFDTTIGKPIFWNGTVWKDAMGNTV